MTVLQQELSRELFFHLDRDKAVYMRSVDQMISDPPFGMDTARAFPHSLRDMALAGNSLACELSDACVFYLMRVMEKGLAALAKVFAEPFQHENWHNIIERLESRIRKIDPSAGPDWKNKQQFYSEAASQFMFVKEAWRNHVMHGRSEYDSGRAISIYRHVADFMAQLASGGLTE